jgi:hypothetical protein
MTKCKEDAVVKLITPRNTTKPAITNAVSKAFHQRLLREMRSAKMQILTIQEHIEGNKIKSPAIILFSETGEQNLMPSRKHENWKAHRGRGVLSSGPFFVISKVPAFAIGLFCGFCVLNTLFGR